jgi:glutathione transport system permease protein
VRRARVIGRRATTLFARVLLDALLPLLVTFVVVSYFADYRTIDTSQLKANTFLMNTRPLFQVVAPAEQLAVALKASAILLLTTIAGAAAVGIPTGIAYGWSMNRRLKAIAWSIGTVASSLPAFFWAVAVELLMIAIYLKLDLRFLPIAGFGVDEHLVLPSLALGIRPAAYIFRFTGMAVEEIRHTDYVRTAVAKGLPERRLLTRHVLPNAAPSVIAATVLGARNALSSLVIVEFIYVWGGAGLTFVQALGNRRLELATQLALSFAIGSILLSLAADLARSRIQAATSE